MYVSFGGFFFVDPHFWDEFSQQVSNFKTLQDIEDRSKNDNSWTAWKLYRYWRRETKRQIMNGKLSAFYAQLMPCLGTQEMPPRPPYIYPPDPDTNHTEKLLRPVPEKYKNDLVVTGRELGDTRLAIMDSGCNADTHPLFRRGGEHASW